MTNSVVPLWNPMRLLSALLSRSFLGTSLLGALLFVGIAAPARAAEHILDLYFHNRVEMHAYGADTNAVSLVLRNKTANPIQVLMPAGLYFVAPNKMIQTMVSTSNVQLDLAARQEMTVSLPAASTNIGAKKAGSDSRFSIRGATGQRDLEKLIPAMQRAAATYPVNQAAVWILTEDASYEQLGTLKSGPDVLATRIIGQADVARALRILSDAGIDVRNRAVWRDRAQLAASVENTELASWLRTFQ